MSRYTPQLVTERIYVETSEYAIVGTITLPDVQRMSDALNNRERDFLVLTDAVAVSKLDESEAGYSFLALGREHIVLAFSLSDQDVLEEQDERSGLAARLRIRAIRARLHGDQLVSG